MDLPQEIDDYLRESIEYSLGLPVSTRTLELKLQSSEEAQRHLRDQCFYLKSKLMEKDKTIECVRVSVFCTLYISISVWSKLGFYALLDLDLIWFSDFSTEDHFHMNLILFKLVD